MGDVATREPAVAGRFYPGTRAEIDGALARLFSGTPPPARRALGAVVPHAGWMYSGPLAARTLAAVEVPARVVVLCPNHTGRGARVAVSMAPSWRTPIGDVQIDLELGAALLDELAPRRAHASGLEALGGEAAEPVRGAAADESAHAREHAIEVLVPLLCARHPGLRLVPIVLASLTPVECRRLAAALVRAWARLGLAAGDDVMVVASSDMNHFEDEAETRRRDRLALEALATGDADRLLDTVDGHDISMCGARTVATLLGCAAELGASRPELIGYTTSAAVSGDTSRVVGYAGAIVPMI
jgi:predicted class III extradiol MEMO1 family dioxygenase